MSCNGDKYADGRAERRRKGVGDVLDGLEADGFPGLVKTVFRMIGQHQPSIDCLVEADNAFGSVAVGGGKGGLAAEQTWDAALDMAACLKGALLDPGLPEPDPPEPEPPEPTPPSPDGRDSLADVVLAALLVRLRDEGRPGGR
jgi:hypothetical protein